MLPFSILVSTTRFSLLACINTLKMVRKQIINKDGSVLHCWVDGESPYLGRPFFTSGLGYVTMITDEGVLDYVDRVMMGLPRDSVREVMHKDGKKRNIKRENLEVWDPRNT